eukprot:TRINITY_DN4469_c0_g1_i1.p1 TRINITY_DN4469_c0_g1~~TRINITY_DN4469_c0_g1_i1.p1  ORF type:complete len:111 (-),score=7.20 TRINITY_DN4469_c0_g1_i1:49-381(-)
MNASKPKVSKPARLPTIRSGSAKRGKAKAAVAGGKTRSSRAGLVFPVGRIKRKLKDIMQGQRVGVGSAIYMAATLEYLTAELLEIAGNDATRDHKKRITPLNIKKSLKSD